MPDRPLTRTTGPPPALHCLLVRGHASYFALALLALLFALSCYRAAVQSITVDEAFTYNRSVSAPLSRTFKVFDANNHPLHTMLAKAAVALFGVSEFALRMPALLGALIYFAAVFRLSRAMFGDSWLMLTAVACLSMNPTVLDFLSISRGYGMAMALVMAALDLLRSYLDRPERLRLLHLAAVALALAVTANLTTVFPGVALALVFTALYIVDGGPQPLERRPWHVMRHFLLPGLVMASALLAVPLAPAKKGNFYVGANSLPASSFSLVTASLWRYRNPWWHGPAEKYILPLLPLLARCAVPAVLISVLIAAVSIAGRRLRQRSSENRGQLTFRDPPEVIRTTAGPGNVQALSKIEKPGDSLHCGLRAAVKAACRLSPVFGSTPDWADRLFLLNGGTLLAGIGLAIVAWRAFGVLLPIRRTGLWLVPLFTLACLGLLARAGRWRAPLVATALLCLIQFALQFDVTCYDEWFFDSSTREIVDLLRGRVPSQAPIRIGANWTLEQSLEFYKTKYKLRWIIGRGGPDGEFDYYILFREDKPVVQKRNLRIIREYPFSGASLAVPPGDAAP